MTKLNITPTNVIINREGKLSACVGPEATLAFSLRALIVALELEAKRPGMTLVRGPSARQRAKRLTGLKTNDFAKLIEAVRLRLNEQIDKCLVVEADEGKYCD